VTAGADAWRRHEDSEAVRRLPPLIVQQRPHHQNRLRQLTSGLKDIHKGLYKYRRAKQEVQEKTRRGQGENYIGCAAEVSEEEEEVKGPEQWQDLGGLGRLGKRVDPFTDTLRKEKRQQKEILGAGGEYVLRENQVLRSPEGVHYKIVGYLGQGTFGQVVRCINLRTGSQHAIKIIKNKQ
jgi:hypothetical protein